MTDTSQYKPPEVWVWEKGDSPNWRYSSMNRPIAGATHEKVLPRGKHPLQLYSLGTPNGVKVTILLEELLAAGHKGAEYDAWLIRIGEGEQFGHRVEPAVLLRAEEEDAPQVREAGGREAAALLFVDCRIRHELGRRRELPGFLKDTGDVLFGRGHTAPGVRGAERGTRVGRNCKMRPSRPRGPGSDSAPRFPHPEPWQPIRSPSPRCR